LFTLARLCPATSVPMRCVDSDRVAMFKVPKMPSIKSSLPG
jgi:hypothetical protein